MINCSYVSQTALIDGLKHIGGTLIEIEITQTNMKKFPSPNSRGKEEDDGLDGCHGCGIQIEVALVVMFP